MRISIRHLAALLLPCLSACGGVDVRYEYDPRFDFANSLAYDWRGFYGAPTDLIENAMRDRVDSWLTQKGYQLKAPGSRIRAVVFFDLPPDAWDGAAAKRNPTQDSGLGAARRIARAAGQEPTRDAGPRQDREPSVMLAFVDRTTFAPLWSGIVVGEFGDTMTESEQLEAVARTVDALMANFPPGG